jgi:hypothetical protein
MTRRRKLTFGIALAGAAALVWAIPACRYRIVGTLRREPFYQGMPASYWRDRFLQFEAYDERKKWEWEVAGSPRQPFLSRLRDSLEEMFPAIASPEVELPQLHDPGAIPVLIVLLLDEDPVVSSRGEGALMVIGEPAVPALLKLLQDGNPNVRLTAILTLNSVTDYSAEGAIPALRQLTRDVNKGVALEAIATLAYGDAGFRDEAVSALIELLKDQDRQVREDAIGVLGNLCFSGLSQRAKDAVVSAIGEATRDRDQGVAEHAKGVLKAIAAPIGRKVRK